LRTKNAKVEFLKHIEAREVSCVDIYYRQNKIAVRLRLGFSADAFNKFLNKLDFNYDAGFGGQALFGTIWYADGTYSERGEYDGSEWWEHRARPEVPEYLAAQINEDAPEYACWLDMVQRCYNFKHPSYEDFGGRGILVCDRWIASFETFLADMGSCPPGFNLSLIDDCGGYSPDNCKWVI
jgi:hypothetical protein